ncbi:minor capsid protein [Bacillus vallismortis]|uniref:putative minor capsid protein n=1 Tax=Bacillus vallismortis TaxID=72361 RepID=UPI000C2A5183|nr:putative minor capsid protein [Bacillus vallismortis]PJZ00379.1 minor capsid protein [Bacillus vallismortis]
MAKPIPANLLFHSIEYEEYAGDSNGWGGNFEPAQSIENVRVEPVTAIMRSNIRDDVEGESIVFIDRLNSTPYKKLKEKSRVTFEGKTYEIQRVKALYDENPGAPHHYEVEIK